MPPSLKSQLVPRTPAQWMAILGLIPFGAGAWMQARQQRDIRIAQVAIENRLGELERRTSELTARSGAVGVRIAVKGDSSAGTRIVYDSLADGTRAMSSEVTAVAREFERLTAVDEQLRARRSALRGVAAPANLLLAFGALLTVAGVLTDIRQFRQLRRRAA